MRYNSEHLQFAVWYPSLFRFFPYDGCSIALFAIILLLVFYRALLLNNLFL